MKNITLLITALVLLSGCTYYEITDPTTEKVYYTTNWDRKDNKSGILKFVDKSTDKEITLTNAEVAKIKEKDYKAAIGK